MALPTFIGKFLKRLQRLTFKLLTWQKCHINKTKQEKITNQKPEKKREKQANKQTKKQNKT